MADPQAGLLRARGAVCSSVVMADPQGRPHPRDQPQEQSSVGVH
ncbi:unnamed protein product [Ectocarpus sp. CCAP 1310/34]|nr:unnamed protein product [Ectocarpus sp. CCAP 1310/34]